jgi:type I restriction enzyme S subunit
MKWTLVTLNDIIKVKSGDGLIASQMKSEGAYAVYGGNGINGYYDEYMLEKPTLILGRVGAKCGVVHITKPKSWVTDNALIVTFDEKKADQKYLYWALTLADLNKLSSSTAQPVISGARIYSTEIPLPTLSTQQKIATILDEADALRRKDKALLAKYHELLQAVFYDMFGDPVKNEKGWETRKIGDLANISSGSTPSRSNDEYYGGDILWVKTTEVNGKRIYDTEEKITELGLKNSSCKLYPVNSIILAMYGQGKTRGQVGILGVPATTNQACAVIQPSRLYNSNFLLCLLGQLYYELRNESRGGNQQNLNGGIIKDFEIMYPPLKLQNNFSVFFENIISQKSQIILQQTYSENLFQSLMQRAFKGELVG